MPEFKFPEDVQIYNATDADLKDRIRLSMPVAEASELLLWLQLLQTGFMDDAQYLYFAGFKRRLADAIKLPVAEDSKHWSDGSPVDTAELEAQGDN